MRRREMLAMLAQRLAALQVTHPARIAIDGIDAAGKTTLADELVGPLEAHGRPVIRASIDGFHRRYLPAQRHYFERVHPRERADIIVSNGDPANLSLLVGQTE